MRSQLIRGSRIAGTGFSVRKRPPADPVFNEQFRRRVETWCRGRSGDLKVRLDFGTDGSYTDMQGNITVDKTKPEDGRPGDKTLAVWGFASHELCHHRWTARSVWLDFVAKNDKVFKKSEKMIQEARAAFQAIPNWQAAGAADSEARQAEYTVGMVSLSISELQAQIAAAAPAEAKKLTADLKQLELVKQALEAEMQAAVAKRDGILGPHKKAFDDALAQRHAAVAMTLQATQTKDCFNIIEDGRIETHLRVTEPNEYRQISLMNHVWPRIRPSYNTGEAPILVPCPDGYVPTDAGGNELPLTPGADGKMMVAVPPNTELLVWTDKPLDPKRQMHAALLGESVPEFSSADKDLHPAVRACLDECRPLIDEGVRGNTRECLAASEKVWAVVAKHGLWPVPEDGDSNTGQDGQQAQQGQSGQGQQGQGQPGQGQGQGQPGQGQGSGQGQPGQGQGGGGQSGDPADDDGGSQSGSGAGGAGGSKKKKQQAGGGPETSGSPFERQDQWQDRGDAGKTGDGVNESSGAAEEGEDGGGISKKDREDAEKGKAGSASADEAKNAADKAEKDAEGDKRKADADARGAEKRGDIEGKEWAPPSNQSIESIEKITPKGPRAPRGHLTQHGNRLAAELEKLRVEAEGPQRFEESGRVDRRRLTRAMTGDTRVFWREGRELNTEIALDAIYDLSGSMGGLRHQLQEAATAVAIAAEKLEVPHAAWGFDGGHSSARHFELKPYGIDRDAFGSIGDNSIGGGGTPTSEAIEFGIARLSKRPEETRVMLVFTDGMPNDGGEETRKRIEEARRQGHTVLGCYFNSSSSYGPRDREHEGMKQIFGQDFVVLESMADLAPQVGKRLMKMMLTGKRKRR